MVKFIEKYQAISTRISRSTVSAIFHYSVLQLDFTIINPWRAAANDYFNCRFICWMSEIGEKYWSVFPKARHDLLKCLVSVHNAKRFFISQSKFVIYYKMHVAGSSGEDLRFSVLLNRRPKLHNHPSHCCPQTFQELTPLSKRRSAPRRWWWSGECSSFYFSHQD